MKMPTEEDKNKQKRRQNMKRVEIILRRKLSTMIKVIIMFNKDLKRNFLLYSKK